MNTNSAANSAPATVPPLIVPSRPTRRRARRRAQGGGTGGPVIERAPACMIGEMPAAANLIVICWKPQHMHSTIIIDSASASTGLRTGDTPFMFFLRLKFALCAALFQAELRPDGLGGVMERDRPVGLGVDELAHHRIVG